jgi:uncharacterized protein (DUF885 family)
MLSYRAAKVCLALTLLLATPLLVLAQSSNVASTPVSSETVRQFRAFLSDDWKRWMHEYPETATGVGYPGEHRRWTDESPSGFEARVKHLRESLATLKQINWASLPPRDQLNYDLYRELLETSIEGLQYGDDPFPLRGVVPSNRWMSVNQMHSPPLGAPDTIASMPHEKISDYEDILARLEALRPVTFKKV